MRTQYSKSSIVKMFKRLCQAPKCSQYLQETKSKQQQKPTGI